MYCRTFYQFVIRNSVLTSLKRICVQTQTTHCRQLALMYHFSDVSVSTFSQHTSQCPDHLMCHKPDGDGVPGHTGPVCVLGDHGGEDLLHVVTVGGGHLLLFFSLLWLICDMEIIITRSDTSLLRLSVSRPSSISTLFRRMKASADVTPIIMSYLTMIV